MHLLISPPNLCDFVCGGGNLLEMRKPIIPTHWKSIKSTKIQGQVHISCSMADAFFFDLC